MGSLVLAAGLQLPVHASAQTSRSSGASIRSSSRRWETRGHLRQRRAIMGLLEPGPGPARLQLDHYKQLKAAGGVAPAQWKFDAEDWWLEEHGLIMEKPTFRCLLGNTSSRATAT